MTSGQRRVLAALGALIVLVLLTVVFAATRPEGERGGAAVSASDRDRSSATTDTTLPLVPVTSGAPLPTTSTVPPSVPLPSADQVAAARPEPQPATTGGPPPAPALSADGALLARPATESTRPVDKAKGCNSAVDPGWRIVECGALKRDDVVLLWVVEARGKGLRALVLRERTAGQWATVLSAADDAGTRWSKIGVRGADVSGDGRPDLVFGFHARPASAGAPSVLGIDVVEGPGTVTLHRAAPGGVAQALKDELHVWEALADGSYEHAVIKVLAGAWRVASTERVARDQVPPSMV